MNFKILAFIPLLFILSACSFNNNKPDTGEIKEDSKTQQLVKEQTNRSAYLGSEESKVETELRIIDKKKEALEVQREAIRLAKDCSEHHTERIVVGEVTDNAVCSPADFVEKAKENVEGFGEPLFEQGV